MNISSPYADVFSDQFLLDQTRQTELKEIKDYSKHTLKIVRIVTGFPLVLIIPGTKLGEKLRKFTTIHRNMIWACEHILHNFRRVLGLRELI